MNVLHVFVGGSLLFGAMAAQAQGTEFSVRWEPRKGGPATHAAVLATLFPGVQPSALAVKVRSFDVEYFTLSPLPRLPGNPTVIVRQRTEAGVPEVTYKVRSPEKEVDWVSQWRCPLSATKESKDERDEIWVSATTKNVSRSISCTVEGATLDKALPPGSATVSRGCRSRMVRYKAGRYKIERWTLAGGRVLMEVSLEAERGDAGRDMFAAQAWSPLLKAKIVPIADSKTELASKC